MATVVAHRGSTWRPRPWPEKGCEFAEEAPCILRIAEEAGTRSAMMEP
jgi:hypothetical protein